MIRPCALPDHCHEAFCFSVSCYFSPEEDYRAISLVSQGIYRLPASSQPTDLCFLRDKPSPLPGNHCLASQPVQSIDRFPGPFLQRNRNQHAHLLSACGEMCKSSHPKITKTSSSHPAGQVLLPNLCAKVL